MTNRSHNFAAVPSAPMRRTSGAVGVVSVGGMRLRGTAIKRCRFGRGPGFAEGFDV